jgi:uncharacterized glyoxalase superfamily protein PhnB
LSQRGISSCQTLLSGQGFDIAWSDDGLAYLRHDSSAFLLQNFYQPEHAADFMMHLLVDDVDELWQHVEGSGLIAKYGVRAEPPSDKPWSMRDFVIVDPTGVLWRIAQYTRGGVPTYPR